MRILEWRRKTQRVQVEQEQVIVSGSLRRANLALCKQAVVAVGNLPPPFRGNGRVDLPAEPEHLIPVDAEFFFPIQPQVTPVQAPFERCHVHRSECPICGDGLRRNF